MSKLFKNNHHHFQIISLLQKFCHWKFPVSEEEAVEAKFGRRVPKKVVKVIFARTEKYFLLELRNTFICAATFMGTSK